MTTIVDIVSRWEDPYVSGSERRKAATALARATGQDSGAGVMRRWRAHRRQQADRADVKSGAERTPEVYKAELLDRLRGRYVAEIGGRGGETTISTRDSTVRLSIWDYGDGMMLLGADGWREYARGQFHRASLAYLCGREDGAIWTVRVPGTMDTVGEAVEWMTPAEVRRAQDAGRWVRRQGDVWAIETVARCDGGGVDGLPASHVWRAETRTLVHRPADGGRKHRPLRVGERPVRFVRGKALPMGRSGRTGRWD